MRRSNHRSWIAIGSLLLLTGSAAADDPPPKQIDLSSVKDALRLYHDGKGHYLVLPAYDSQRRSDHVFYGDGKVFYRQPVPLWSGDGSKRSYTGSIADPRVARGAESTFSFTAGKVSFTCEGRETRFVELPADEARAVLDRALFHEVFWQRSAHALARDDHGHYYYVDRLRDRTSTGGYRGFRVFRGPRGKMRQLRMRNVVTDDRGEIFVTHRGRLRLVLDDPGNAASRSATWFRGRRPTPLTMVPLGSIRTRQLIYRELGVYLGQKLHLPCDDL